VAAGAVVAAEVVRAGVTVAAHVVEASEIGPLVTSEAVGLGVPTRERHRVYGQLSFAPTLDRHMTVATAQRSGDVVRADVATAAIPRLNVQTLLLVTV
jgi:hypothetical protein